MVPSYEQVGDWLEEISGDFPDVFFEELDGGIQLAEEALPDPEFPPGEMYIMGEYCHDLLGRYIVLYYGSFAALAGQYRDAGDLLLFEEGLSPDGLRRLAAAVLETCGGRCACFSGQDGSGYRYAIGQVGGDLRELTRALNQALSGRGGGKPGFVQGSVQAEQTAIRDFFAAL